MAGTNDQNDQTMPENVDMDTASRFSNLDVRHTTNAILLSTRRYEIFDVFFLPVHGTERLCHRVTLVGVKGPMKDLNTKT